ICDDSEPAAIVFEDSHSAISQALEAHPGSVRIGTGRNTAGGIGYDELRKMPPGNLPPLSIDSDDALIIYTSGTTGKPKGAITTHANIIVQHCFINALEWGISSEDRYLVTTPLAHRTGFARLSNSLTLGGTLVVMPKFDPREAVETIASE